MSVSRYLVNGGKGGNQQQNDHHLANQYQDE